MRSQRIVPIVGVLLLVACSTQNQSTAEGDASEQSDTRAQRDTSNSIDSSEPRDSGRPGESPDGGDASDGGDVSDGGESSGPCEWSGRNESPPEGDSSGTDQSYDESLYVDGDTGSDDNAGTRSEPLRTIQEAMDRATEHKKAGRSVHVEIAAGIYREAVEFAYSNSSPGGGSPETEVFVEGAGPEATVIKGSEVFDDWQSDGNGVFRHEWKTDDADWGVASDPTGGYVTDCQNHSKYCADSPELVLRREMVFVDGERMRQVLSPGAMGPGTFRVDHSADELFLQPPNGVDLSMSTVEVAVRRTGWFTDQESNVTVRDLGVEQVATPWKFGKAAFVFAGTDNTVENVRVTDNNFDGLAMWGEGLRVRNVALHRNGHSGLGATEVVDVVVEDSTVRANNWRGALGGYTGWSTGNKFFRGRDVTIRDTSFRDHQSRGLWLDTDLKNVVLENVEARGNLKDNIFVERTQGPVELRSVVSAESEEYGLLLANARNTTVVDSCLLNNEKGGIHVSGDEGGVEIENFQTGRSLTVRTRELTVRNSVIRGVAGGVQAGAGDEGRFLIGTTFRGQSWNEFVDSYRADDNTWSARQSKAFEWNANQLISFEQWQSRTGEDENSVFEILP